MIPTRASGAVSGACGEIEWNGILTTDGGVMFQGSPDGVLHAMDEPAAGPYGSVKKVPLAPALTPPSKVIDITAPSVARAPVDFTVALGRTWDATNQRPDNQENGVSTSAITPTEHREDRRHGMTYGERR